MRTRIATDINECGALWSRFSPRESLFDLWEFRFPFWDVFRFEPRFLVLERDGADAGMLPLWYQPEQRCHLWFGDTGDCFHWQEGTSIWARSAEDARALIDACPRPALLTSISQACAERWRTRIPFEAGNPKSVLPLASFRTSEEYVQSLPRKLRSNLRHDQRAIAARGPEILRNGPSAVPKLMRLNAMKFADSPFRDPRMIRVFEHIIHAASSTSYAVTTIAVRIDGDVAAVDLLFFYDHVAYSLLCGSDTRRFPGIGHFMTLLDIDEALHRSCTVIDFAEYEAAEDRTKPRLFPSVPQYTLTLPAP